MVKIKNGQHVISQKIIIIIIIPLYEYGYNRM